ncbi:MAG: undecaprenyl-diphosphatase UppP [Candidatus Woykebacteria bacterium GWA1_44_8]|uniref:Undecaprenyl-diphosphatase n=1 Tax=Candidatus Woykebacteria bacterium GWA1_44_8 TaxID=1802591 RepID=A0A1G1W2B1_9BACT|nr:MAG: undecaprenyl-diphosphatase UppP [Candidatus Woykebacteria bacterium GWA1_44_8]
MQEIIVAAFLGIVQGLTEFLPISSSGHLIVLPKLFGWQGVVDSLSFDVALHTGSTVAVVGFFWRDWLGMIGSFLKSAGGGKNKVLADPSSRLLLLLILGSIPAAAAGLLFQDFIETNVRSVLLVGSMLIIFGFVLWWVDKVGEQKRSFKNVGWWDALLVGVAQAISLIPGVSRSGITITAARGASLNREAAVRFSFLLSTPAIVGATALTFKDYVEIGSGNNFDIFLIGFVSAAISGWLAIKFLLAFVQKHNFNIFVIYRVIFGLFLILWAIKGS